MGAYLRREAIKLNNEFFFFYLFFFLNECKGRGLDFKDIWGEEGWSSGKSRGCIRGFEFCLRSTIHLSDCRTVTSDAFLPFLASKIDLAFFSIFLVDV